MEGGGRKGSGRRICKEGFVREELEESCKEEDARMEGKWLKIVGS